MLEANVEQEADDAPDPSAPSALPESERVVLFTIHQDGQEPRPIYAPKKVGPNVALQYMRDVRRHGREHAMAGIMERMLGSEGLDALADYDELTEDDLAAVMSAVEQHVLGPMERKGKG